MPKEISPTIRMMIVSPLSLEPISIGSEVRVDRERYKGTVIRIYQGITKDRRLADVCMTRWGKITCSRCEGLKFCEAPITEENKNDNVPGK